MTLDRSTGHSLAIAAAAVLMLVAGCSVAPKPKEAPSPAVREAQTLADYQRLFAERIHQVNNGDVYTGRPPVPLQAVIVYSAEIDQDGRVLRTRLLRSKGIPALDAKAVASIERAAPYPRPPAHLMRGRRSLEISESWLFDDAGRFQLRTLSPGQLLQGADGRLI